MLYPSTGKKLALSCLFALAWSSTAFAQAVSCSGVPEWNASTQYKPGDKMVYQGRLYEAQINIWNAPPTYCSSCGWYKDLGSCSTGGNQSPSASLTAPSAGSTFAAGANITVSATPAIPMAASRAWNSSAARPRSAPTPARRTA